MATERIDIVIREDGARVVNRNIQQIGESAEKSHKGVSLLTSVLATLGTYLTVSKLIQYADGWASAAGSIRIATKNTQEALAVTEKLFDVAQRTRQDYGATVDLYSKAARAGAELGASQERIIQFTEGVNKSLAVQNSNATKAAGALMQLGQALGNGVVRAEEYNSINEGASYILQIVAKNIDGVDGSLARLRQRMLAGQLSSKMFFDAFLKGSADIDKDFAKSSFTIGQSFTILNNAIMRYVGESDNAIGVSQAIGRAAVLVARNFKTLADAVVDVTRVLLVGAAAWGVYLGAMKVNALVDAAKASVAYAKAIADGSAVALGSAKAEQMRATALAATAAQQAAANAAVVASEAAVAAATAESASVAATASALQANAMRAKIETQRQSVISGLAMAQADMASARAQVTAAESAGALSFALAAKREGLARLAVAETAHTRQLQQLAILDRERVGASVAQTEALAAQTAAQNALNAAQARATAASGSKAAADVAATAAASSAAAAQSAAGASVLAQAWGKVTTAVSAAFGYITKFFALVNANPFTAIVVSLTVVVGLLLGFGDRINAGIDGVTKMSNVLQALGQYALEGLTAVGNGITALFDSVLGLVGTSLSGIADAVTDVVGPLISEFARVYAGVGDGFAGMARTIARTFDILGAYAIGLYRGWEAVFNRVPALLGQVWANAYNKVADYIELMVNIAITGVNKIGALTGQSLIEAFTLDRKAIDDTVFSDLGADVVKAMREGIESQGGALEGAVNAVLQRAQQNWLKENPFVLPRQDPGSAARPPAGPPVDPNAEKARDKMLNQLRSLLNIIAPIEGAMLEYAKAEKTLNDAQKMGLITGAEKIRYLGLLRDHYRDILDPLGAVNREMERQTQLLGMDASARQVAEQVYQTSQDLKSRGIVLTQEETAALTAQYAAMQKLTEATQARDALVAATQGQRNQFGTATDALGAANAQQVPGVTQGDVAQQVNGMAPELFEGTQTQLDAQVAAFEDMYARIDVLRGKNLISEQTAEIARSKIAGQQQAIQLKSYDTFFDTMAQLSTSGNKKLAAIGKAAAIAQATISGIVAVQEALRSGPPPYNYIQAAAVGVVAAANVAKIAGFQEGGYTGNVGVSDVAGVVHGKEFVVNAEGTARNRAALEAMNNGATIGGGGAAHVTVNVINRADGTTTRTEERNTPDGRELDIIIEASVSKNIRGGGGIASTMESQYALNRANGSPR